jgi:alanyl-tRNA synthetase
MLEEQLMRVEEIVNNTILADRELGIDEKSFQKAKEEGAMALFGEKYGDTVRTVTIDGEEERISMELCGGTHVDSTGDIGLFLIVSEGSAAAGVRRIEAVTGRGAFEVVKKRNKLLKDSASLAQTSIDSLPERIFQLRNDLEKARKEITGVKEKLANSEFKEDFDKVEMINGSALLGAVQSDTNADTLRVLADRFREKFSSGVLILGSNQDDKPVLICMVTDDLVKKGLHAGELAKIAAEVVGGSGGGRPNLAQAGGKDVTRLKEAVDKGVAAVRIKLK